jgi:hypothetical protein
MANSFLTAYLRVCVCARKCVCACVCTCLCVCVCICVRMGAYMYERACVCHHYVLPERKCQTTLFTLSCHESYVHMNTVVQSDKKQWRAKEKGERAGG